MTATLEQKIVGALTDDNMSASALLALGSEVDMAIIEGAASAQSLRVASLDPLQTPDPVAARAAAEDATFAVQRLRALHPRIAAKQQQRAEQESARQWEADYFALLPERDALAAEFREFYPKMAAELVDLLRRAEQIDARASTLAGLAASGEHRRLLRVELAARGLDSFSSTTPPIGDRLRLPVFGRGEQMMWPAAEPMPPAFYALPPHAGDQWHVHAAARGDALRRDNSRVISFYDDAAREREEREASDKARPAA